MWNKNVEDRMQVMLPLSWMEPHGLSCCGGCDGALFTVDPPASTPPNGNPGRQWSERTWRL